MLLDILQMIGSALFMIFFFGACIFIHELGHFLAARMCGLHIVAFSIGFRKVWAKKINGVEYRIGWIPCGGYVDLPQIDASGDVIKDENGNILPRVEPWKRMVTAIAGPLFNILFGLALGCVIWVAGLPQESPEMTEFKVKTVEKGSPEYAAGLRPGDVIIRRNGQTFRKTWGSFARDIMLNVGETTLTVLRNGEEIDITYLPAINKKVAPSEEIPYPFFRPELPVTVCPEKDSPAWNAGLRDGDRVLAVDGKEIIGSEDLHLRVIYSRGRELRLTVEGKYGTVREVSVKPEPYPGTTEKDGMWMTGIAFSANGLTAESSLVGLPAEGQILHGDKVLAVDGAPCKDVEAFRARVKEAAGKDMTIRVLRNGTELDVKLTPVFVTPYHIGVTFRIVTHPSPFRQFGDVLNLTWRSLKSVSAGIGRTLGFDAGYTVLGPKHLSGPVGIGKYLYISVYRGSLILGLNLVVLISFNLGLLNLMPIPVLDGGHVVLALLEMIFRRPVPAKVLQPIAYTFICILIFFMLFVTFYDIKKMIPVSASASEAASGEKTEAAPQHDTP